MRLDQTVGLIGAGNVTEALLRGLLDRGTLAPGQCLVANRSSDARLERLSRELGVRTTRDKPRLMKESGVVILTVKPQDTAEVLAEIAPHVSSRHLVLSVAAGVTLGTIEDALGQTPVVRAMPNTGCAVGASATALCRGRWADEGHLAVARAIFEAVGRVVVLPEPMFDLVTGLSGTGPAYVYLLAEAMVAAGEHAGLSHETALALVVQTMLGAGRMLAETGEEPEALRARVTSPNGTTMAAMKLLDDADFRGIVERAVERATQRAAELREAAAARARPVRTTP